MKTSLIAVAACLAATPAFAEEAAGERNDRDTIVVTGQRDLDDRTEVSGRLGLTATASTATPPNIALTPPPA